MLYLIQNDSAVAWLGAPIDEVTYPGNIEQLWTADDLAAIGLFAPAAAAAIPAGKRLVSSSVQTVGGVVITVNVVEDIPAPDPSDFDLRPDQFFSMMDIAGLTSPVNAAIAGIADPTQQIIAKNKLAHTLVFTRDNPLFETLKSAVGVTDAQIDAMWLQAKDL